MALVCLPLQKISPLVLFLNITAIFIFRTISPFSVFLLVVSINPTWAPWGSLHLKPSIWSYLRCSAYNQYSCSLVHLAFIHLLLLCPYLYLTVCQAPKLFAFGDWAKSSNIGSSIHSLNPPFIKGNNYVLKHNRTNFVCLYGNFKHLDR